MNRLTLFLALAAMLLGVALTNKATAADDARPNIVVVMADDVGLGDIAHYYREYTDSEPPLETPNFDALAAQGMWFTDAHSPTALCSPTRYSMISGNYTYRSYAPWGIWQTFRKSPFEPNQATLASIAKDAGYATGFVGKWHLGGDFNKASGEGLYRGVDRGEELNVDLTKTVGGGPEFVGFDYAFNVPCGVQGPVYTMYENGVWYPFSDESEIIFLDDDTVLDPKFLTSKGSGMGDSMWNARRLNDILSSKVVDFIEANSGDEPFLVYFCSPAVHVPWTPPATFDGEQVAGSTPTPHMDMIRELDLQIGRIVKALKGAGEYENTLFIFTSDNGGLFTNPKQHGHDASGLFNGFKNSPLEGGHRVPFIVTWPAKIEAGTSTDELIVAHDIVATVADIVGATVPEDEVMDSQSFLPILTAQPGAEGRDWLLLQAGANHEVLFRKGDWKLIMQSNPKQEVFEPIALFNIAETPFEPADANLIDDPSEQERVAAMLKEYLALRASPDRTTPVIAP
ncbi:MAG: arylsulfatase [Planctomycetota bacterium]